MASIVGRPLIPGNASGPTLKLSKPISLWGAVEPSTGRISDPRHPEYGTSVVGKVLAVPAAIGSSSSSAIMLELLRLGTAPAAIVFARADAIVALGVVVAQELGYATIPVVEVTPEDFADIPTCTDVRVTPQGRILINGK
jgi:predicted aconitase with swiveling domain